MAHSGKNIIRLLRPFLHVKEAFINLPVSVQKRLLARHTILPAAFVCGCEQKRFHSHSDNKLRSSSRNITIDKVHKKINDGFTNRKKHTTSYNPYEMKNDKPNMESGEWTHFGYEKVKEDEKVNKVYDVFENVATSYDVMNDLMSAGTHRLWKNHFVRQLQIKPGMKILDMAGGTGDIAFKMLDNIVDTTYGKKFSDADAEIIVSDINQAMLDVGKKRAESMGIDNAFQWIAADAEDLPFEDDSLDLYTIAFGIRNTTHIEKVLEEAFRVLKVGGRFSCLEFSHVENPAIKSLYDSYSFQVIPVLGQIFASDWKSYQYLVESIRRFPNQEDFADMIYDAGFSNVMYENMTFGVVAVHDGYKI